jgi:hypothetical protein
LPLCGNKKRAFCGAAANKGFRNSVDSLLVALLLVSVLAVSGVALPRPPAVACLLPVRLAKLQSRPVAERKSTKKKENRKNLFRLWRNKKGAKKGTRLRREINFIASQWREFLFCLKKNRIFAEIFLVWKFRN